MFIDRKLPVINAEQPFSSALFITSLLCKTSLNVLQISTNSSTLSESVFDYTERNGSVTASFRIVNVGLAEVREIKLALAYCKLYEACTIALFDSTHLIRCDLSQVMPDYTELLWIAILVEITDQE